MNDETENDNIEMIVIKAMGDIGFDIRFTPTVFDPETFSPMKHIQAKNGKSWQKLVTRMNPEDAMDTRVISQTARNKYVAGLVADIAKECSMLVEERDPRDGKGIMYIFEDETYHMIGDPVLLFNDTWNIDCEHLVPEGFKRNMKIAAQTDGSLYGRSNVWVMRIPVVKIG